MLRSLLRFVLFLFAAAAFAAETAPAPKVRSLKITLLSTMLADGPTLGEWGFAALVEVDGHRLLFDTGAHSDVVLRNARALHVDLTTVPEVVLSHSHEDHVGGLLTLRASVLPESPHALARVHVGQGLFLPRHEDGLPGEANPMILIKSQHEKTGGQFVVHNAPVQLYPGVWLTGPVPRKHPERNWSGSGTIETAAGTTEDNIPEDSALLFDTEQGLVILTGCGHAGVVNILEYARVIVRPARIHALIGGIHLFNASEKTLAWTSGRLRELGVESVIGAHCTGIETVYRLRADLGLDRKNAVVGAVGADFELGAGIHPGPIAR